MAVRGRLLQYEGWDLANGAAFPSPWTSSNTGVTINVQSGAGRFALAGVAGAYVELGQATYQRTGATDFEMAADFTFSSAANESYGRLCMGDSGTSSYPSNGIAVVYSPNASLVELQRRDAGVATAIGTSSAFTFAGGVLTKTKFTRVGYFIGVKVWLSTGVEPSGWMATATESLYRGPAYSVPILGMLGGNVAAATTLDWDNLTVTSLTSGSRRRSTSLR